MRVTQKKVKVLYNGPIKAKGWVYGPILNPYMESTKIIFAMLKDGIKVVEVLKNNSTLVLNATNFDKNNNVGLGGDDGLGDDDLFQPVSNEVPTRREEVATQEIVASIEVEEVVTMDEPVAEVITEEVAEVITEEVAEAPVERKSKKNKKK